MSSTPDGGRNEDVIQATRRPARGAATPRGEPERLFGSGSVTWAAAVLRDQEMPSDEIRAVVTSADPEIVHRHLELHLERLEERLGAQRRALAAIERLLVEGGGDGRPRRSPYGSGESD
jgi:hypothetical protein